MFDGERFAQLIEGPDAALHQLMRNIGNDPRHTRLRVLHQGPLMQRHFAQFSLGYADTDQIDLLEKRQGESAVAAFVSLAPRLDLAR